jgi:uncharacterized protein YndB with AHSA1/START domain
MKQIQQTYTIKAPVTAVWRALTDPQAIGDWGGGPAEMSGKEGETFSLWGGDIHGINTKVVPQKRLEQDWFGGDWPEPSKVVFTVKAVDGNTVVTLHHSNIPDREVSNFADGWKDYYLGAIQELLEH